MNRLVRGGRAFFCCGIVVAWAVPALSLAGDWPTFRGADRTAVSSDTGLLQKWGPEGPKLVWQKPGAGRGYASLTIAGKQIFTLGDGPSTVQDEDEYLLCFDRESGDPAWKAKTGPAWNSGQANWQSSRSTPTVDGDRVYVITPHGELVCCETASGKELWRKHLKNEFKGQKGDGWGYSESPLVDGDLLICTPGGGTTTMATLNKLTGDVVWKAVRPGDRGAGHSSTVISNISGRKVYVQVTASGPLGVDAADGKLLWSYEIPQTTCVIPTPIIRGDLVFFTVGYGRGAGLLQQVTADGGGVTVKEIYGVKPALGNKHGGVVLVGDYVYGDSEDKGIPQCCDLMTGTVKWQNRGPGSGSASVVSADGCLYIHFANGTMALAKADPGGYVELGSFKVPGSGERPSWAHPVIADGHLYLRENDTILCYDIRAQ